MQRTERRADPQAFWRTAAVLGAELANEARERATDPLAWVAALQMAMEAVLKEAGPLFEADWARARRWRDEQASKGVVFGIAWQDGEQETSS